MSSSVPSNETVGVATLRPVPRAAWIVLAIAMVAIFYRASRSFDDANFWYWTTSCAHAGDWQGVYDRDASPYALHSYGNLSMLVILYPLGYLSQPAMRTFLIFVILGMWYLMYRLMLDGMPDSRKGFFSRVPWLGLAPILGMILAGRFLLNDLNLKQLNLITFVSGWAGLALMLSHRQRLVQIGGSAALAFSIGLKLTTLPFLAMLLIKRAWWQAAAVAALSAVLLWWLPYAAMGPETHAGLSKSVEGNTLNMWLQITDTTRTWSFTNFLHYRTYMDPLWPSLAEMPPRTFQTICFFATLLIGLPTLHILLKRSWKQTNLLQLWEEVAMIGVAWALIDPDGRTAHFVSMVPAFCLIIYRRLEAWHYRRELPRVWEWTVFLAICATNLWLVRLAYPIRHYYYMHSGLFPLGMVMLYLMTYYEVLRARRQTAVVESAAANVAERSEELSAASVATRAA